MRERKRESERTKRRECQLRPSVYSTSVSFLQYENNVCVRRLQNFLRFCYYHCRCCCCCCLCCWCSCFCCCNAFLCWCSTLKFVLVILFSVILCVRACACTSFLIHISYCHLYLSTHISISIFARCVHSCFLNIDKVIAVLADKRPCNNVSQILPPCIIPSLKLLHDTYFTNKI